jgi:hypothetical protein
MAADHRLAIDIREEKRMSDVERICEQNHQRVRWAEEYTDTPAPVVKFPSRRYVERARRKEKRLRVAALACAMFCGMGTTFVGIGIAELNTAAIITGGLIVLVFLLTGINCEAAAEEATEHG